MSAEASTGWEQDSQTLFLHTSGVRIERRVYRKKDGWVLVPVDLDQKVLEFSPDSKGLDEAFAAFAGGAWRPEAPVASPEILKVRAEARQDEKPDEATEDEEEDEDES